MTNFFPLFYYCLLFFYNIHTHTHTNFLLNLVCVCNCEILERSIRMEYKFVLNGGIFERFTMLFYVIL